MCFFTFGSQMSLASYSSRVIGVSGSMGFRIEFLLKGIQAAVFCYADEEDGACQFADIAVAGQGCCLRLASGATGGDDEQAAAVEEGLQVNGNGLVHGSCQHEDDGLLSLDEEIPDVLLQSAAETAYDTLPIIPHLHRPIIALQHHVHGNGARC